MLRRRTRTHEVLVVALLTLFLVALLGLLSGGADLPPTARGRTGGPDAAALAQAAPAQASMTTGPPTRTAVSGEAAGAAGRSR
jgi:hypothetical protein